MRKIIFLMVVALIVAMLAAPVGAKRVVNETVNEGYTQYEIQAWFGNNEYGSSEGSAWAVDGNNGAHIGIDWSAPALDCPNPWGVASLSIHGQGVLDELEDPNFMVSPTKGKDKFTDGEAYGVFTEGNFYVKDCVNYEAFSDSLIGGSFFIDMDGTGGSLYKTSNSSSFHIPGDYNSHRNERGTYRFASGLIEITPPRVLKWTFLTQDGAIGEVSWSEHTNKHSNEH